MSELQHAKSYRDLMVYQTSRQAAREIYELSKSFPREEMFSLTDQIRRSSRSVGAQIAEAWAKRRYIRHFISKLTDADGEQLETQHWIECALDCTLIDQKQAFEVLSKVAEVGRMLNSMIAKADLFCKEDPQCVREDTAEYDTDY
ncbi:MAG: four helix bundle protein [Lentisphaerae bacterium GWF2_57_35]|nr:MAG: four helix bundle protein [Lentisphaerae bacterium GWF2_57_35]